MHKRFSLLAVVLFTIASGIHWATSALAQEPQRSSLPEAIVPNRVIQLFNGRDLSGWHADVPTKDTSPELPDSFIARDGMLVSLGRPRGHLLTDAVYRDYRLEVDTGFPASQAIAVSSSMPRGCARSIGCFRNRLKCR